MSTANLKSLISDKLGKSTQRIKDDFQSLLDYEELLKTPNLTTMQLNQIQESLLTIETHLRNFSYKSISQTNKELFLGDLKDIFYTYINERNTLQSKLLSIQNKVDTRLLIHKRREKEKNQVLVDRLAEIQSQLQLILHDIRSFDLHTSFSQLLEHYRLINRNLDKILANLGNDNFSLFKESSDYDITLKFLSNVKEEFSKLKNSVSNASIPISDMVRLIESLKLTYIDKIPLYEIYESFKPLKKEEIDIKIQTVIKEPQYLPTMNMTLQTGSNQEQYIILTTKKPEQWSLPETEHAESKMTPERRYDIFKRILKKFDSINLSLLASLLSMENETEVLEYILEIPDEFGFKIHENTLVIEQQHDVLEHIDALIGMFDSGVGKESKI